MPSSRSSLAALRATRTALQSPAATSRRGGEQRFACALPAAASARLGRRQRLKGLARRQKYSPTAAYPMHAIKESTAERGSSSLGCLHRVGVSAALVPHLLAPNLHHPAGLRQRPAGCSSRSGVQPVGVELCGNGPAYGGVHAILIRQHRRRYRQRHRTLHEAARQGRTRQDDRVRLEAGPRRPVAAAGLLAGRPAAKNNISLHGTAKKGGSRPGHHTQRLQTCGRGWAAGRRGRSRPAAEGGLRRAPGWRAPA